MLTNKVRLKGDSCNAPEDIFSSAIAVVFPDEICNQHGDESSSVIYDSTVCGEIELSLANPDSKNTLLFSHFLWNAAVQLADLMEKEQVKDEDPQWDVQGQNVLELGAGTGLAGIMACLLGAKNTVITDYPAIEILANIQANITRNIISRTFLNCKPSTITVEGHTWGSFQDSFSLAHQSAFTRLLVCDCLWMPWEHENLQASIAWFLAAGGLAWIVAGFHTGRKKLAGFFEINSLRRAGLKVDKIWERCANGTEREWLIDRGIENISEQKRWLVIAILRKEYQ
ncbi:Protein N-terminal and lysine N-methyltransferase EFM7 [Erysiphe neolycopersici]|uniref:Protein N-terminal and lysine N-methyltransferase EFM7 n=1 Tax=Erysiphe neolycopersici TaxID=212602 RepID=A0A420HRK2_9PEZI|nr:Protein N-terminal and lysine N-methyltransferase EFM7 [Erysiphe neolycopersici]